MGYKKRYEGSDIPDWATIAIDSDTGTLGYAKTEAEADTFLRMAGDDERSQAFLGTRRGQLTPAQARSHMTQWSEHLKVCTVCPGQAHYQLLCDYGQEFWKPTNEKANLVVAPGDTYEDADMADTKQRLRRMAKFQEMYDTFVTDKAVPGSGPLFMYVTWEQFSTMHREYQDAVKQKLHKDFPFQPLSAYALKINRPGRPPLRQLFQNEMGIYTNSQGVSRHVILRDMGPGDIGERYVQVPANLPDMGSK